MSSWKPHNILGVPPDATREQIRRQYRVLVRQVHPDINGGSDKAEQHFRIIHAAYRALIDALSRPSGTVARQDPPSAAPPPEVQPPIATPPAPTPPATPPASRRTGERPAAGPSGPTSPRPVVRVELELAHVLRPGIVYLRVPGHGPGAVEVPAGADTGTITRAVVKSPAGTRRVDVELRVEPHPTFQRRGLDLVARRHLTLEEAYAGRREVLDAPTGRIELVIPARSRWGDTVRIIGRGVQGPRHRGDLYVELLPP